MKNKPKQPLAIQFGLRITENDAEGIEEIAESLGVTFADATRILIRQGLSIHPAPTSGIRLQVVA